MRFALTDEQHMLQKVAGDLAASLFDQQELAMVTAAGEPVPWQRGWEALCDTGLLGLLVPEDLGGSGGSVTDACVVAEALGSALAPLPFVGSAVAVPALLRECRGSAEALAAVAAGERFSVLVGSDLGWPTESPMVAWEWTPGARGLALRAGEVLEVDGADIVPPPRAIDELHPLAVLSTAPSVDGRLDEAAVRALAVMRVASAAFSLGLASTALDVAVAYAKERIQYGRAIGSFQAVQHLCAEMLTDVETSRSIIYGASWAVEHAPPSEAGRMAAAALAWGGPAGVRVCETSIQVLGGIGVTQQNPAHLRLRGARLFSSAFGGARAARVHLAEQRISAACQGDS